MSEGKETVEDDLVEGLLGRGADQRLVAALLQCAVQDCNRILVGQVGVAPTGGEVVHALSAIQFLRSPWGKKLADVMTGKRGVQSAVGVANRTARALGLTPEWVEGLPTDKIRTAVGIYGDAYQVLPPQARSRLDAPSFRFA